MNDPSAEPLRPLAVEAVRRLQAAGYTAYWAGGCVRDMLLGRTPADYDIATDAPPDSIVGLFPGALTVGKSFGVVRAPVERHFFEIASFREDHDYRDGRRPSSVTFTDAATDAKRRDFTINALFYDPVCDTVFDYVEGRRDLDRRLIRCVGKPAERFSEDRLRMLRAVRFAGSLGFQLDSATAEAIRACAPRIAEISPERIRDELTRTLIESPRPGDALILMEDLGLLEAILPEVSALRQQAQPPAFHPEGDVLTHTAMMLNLMRNATPRLAMAILLHDVGKPATARHDGNRLRFDRHNAAGADIAAAILARLRFPLDDTNAIVHCVRSHMGFQNVKRMKRSTLRRLIGLPTFPIELELHRVDCLASHSILENYDFLVAFRDALAREPVLPEPWVTGHDILKMGVPEGPEVGTWRRKAYDAQLENRFGSREDLMRWIETEIALGTRTQTPARGDSRARRSSDRPQSPRPPPPDL